VEGDDVQSRNAAEAVHPAYSAGIALVRTTVSPRRLHILRIGVNGG
jgi:hypothetical protein